MQRTKSPSPIVTWDVVPKTYNPIDFESLETLFRDANTHFRASLREESTFFCSTSTGSAGAWPAFIPSTLSMTSPFTLFKTVVLGILNVSQVFQYDMMSIFYRINSLVQVLNIFFLFLQKPLSSI